MTFLLNRFAAIGLGTGLALAFGVHRMIDAGIAGFALALGVIGAIYLGALISAPQTKGVALVELAASGATIALALAGLLLAPAWLVVGYVFHGIWDWLHHEGRFGAKIASWYPPFCAVTDFVIGAVVLWVYVI